MDTEKILYLATSLSSAFINTTRKTPEKVSTILVVKRDEIGDMIYTLHCIEALAMQFPNAEITLFCKAMNNGLFTSATYVHHVVNEMDSLEAYYDIQIDFRGDWKTLKRALLGGCGLYLERGSIRLRNKLNGGQTHETITNQETIQSLFPNDFEWPVPKVLTNENDDKKVSELLDSKGVKQYALMHCGARDEARRWPSNRFVRLVNEVYEQYGLKTIFIGSSGEVDLVNTITKETPNAINLAGETSLTELTVLCRRCAFFVGNESGPLHFAITEKRPLVALFGPGVKDVFYPLYDNQKVIHYMKEKDHTNQSIEDSTINRITVEEVLEKLKLVYTT